MADVSHTAVMNVGGRFALSAVVALLVVGFSASPDKETVCMPKVIQPIQQFAEDNGAVGYWPLDDLGTAVNGRAVIGAHPMLVDNSTIADINGLMVLRPVWSGAQLAPWLGNGILMQRFQGETTASGVVQNSPQVSAFVDSTGAETTWALDVLYRGYPLGGPPALTITDPLDDRYRFQLFSTATDNEMQAWMLENTPSTTLVEDFGTFSVPSLFGDDLLHHMRLQASESGGLITWTLYNNGVQVATDSSASNGMPTMRKVTIFAPSGTVGASIAVGHVVAWSGSSVPSVADAVDAAFGYEAESATDRFARLCTSAGIAYDIAS